MVNKYTSTQINKNKVLPLFQLVGYPSVIFRQFFDSCVMESKQ